MAQIIFKDAVHALSLPISLRVISSAHGLFSLPELAQPRMKAEVKRGSLSETISEGKPCERYTFSNKGLAVPSAVTSVVVAAKRVILLNLSTNTTMASLLDLVKGSWVMKSMLTLAQGLLGTCSGCSKPAGRKQTHLIHTLWTLVAGFTPFFTSFAALSQ